jgi:hypothetical protein
LFLTGVLDVHGDGRGDLVVTDPSGDALVLDGADGRLLWTG